MVESINLHRAIKSTVGHLGTRRDLPFECGDVTTLPVPVRRPAGNNGPASRCRLAAQWLRQHGRRWWLCVGNGPPAGVQACTGSSVVAAFLESHWHPTGTLPAASPRLSPPVPIANLQRSIRSRSYPTSLPLSLYPSSLISACMASFSRSALLRPFPPLPPPLAGPAPPPLLLVGLAPTSIAAMLSRCSGGR